MASSKTITDIKVEPGYIEAVLDIMEQVALEVKVKQSMEGRGDHEKNPA